jgi:hypothetical protein
MSANAACKLSVSVIVVSMTTSAPATAPSRFVVALSSSSTAFFISSVISPSAAASMILRSISSIRSITLVASAA